MKKKIIAVCFLFFIGCLAASLLAYAQSQSAHAEKVLVVYYSRTGHNKLVAGYLAKKFNADVEELIDQRKRAGFFGASSAGKDAIAESTTTLAPLKHNPKDYNIILIGGPSWFGNTTPAVRTFIKNNDMTGKKIGLFGTCHLTGVEHAIQEAADLISGNNKFPTMPLRERELKEDVLSKKIEVFYRAVMQL